MRLMLVGVAVMCLCMSVGSDPAVTILEVELPGVKGVLSDCAATDINDYGVIVGGCSSPESHMWMYDGRRYKEVDFPHVNAKASGYDRVLARVDGIGLQAINNQEHLAGWYGYNDNGLKLSSFLRRNGNSTAIRIGTLTEGAGVNDFDEVVGDYRDEYGRYHGFKYVGGSVVSLDVPGAWDSAAMGINNSGWIVGCYSGCARGWLMRNGLIEPIDVAGALMTQARDVNDAGVVVGTYSADNVTAHGFVLDAGGYRGLDVAGASNTVPFAVNNSGVVVGYAVVGNRVEAFVIK